MRHSCERGRQRGLKQVVFLAVREALNAPAHPDSKRQDRTKRRDLARYGARELKWAGVQSCPVARKVSKRKDFRDMQRRMAEEHKQFALAVAARLQGKSWTRVTA